MYQYIFDLLPYKSSFRFVDEISFLDADKVIGHYTLKSDSFFYTDHFEGYPVTPGAILIEIMAQIGLVVMGIYLVTQDKSQGNENISGEMISNDSPHTGTVLLPVFTSLNTSFQKMALPGQRLTVTSVKEYFRFGKLKCQVEMKDASGELVATGVFSGIIKKITK